MGLLAKLFPPPTREKFAAIVTRDLRERGETRDIKFDAERFCLRIGDGSHTMYLHNAYTDYCRVKRSARPEVLRSYSSIVELQKRGEMTLDEAKPNLLPRVREKAYFATFDQHSRLDRIKNPPKTPDKGPLDNFVVRSYAEGLTLELVIDTPDAIQSLGRKQMEQWGVTFDELLTIARDNLWRMSNKDFLQVSPGVFASPWRDKHDVSRLFLHDLIWQLPVKGQHVAALPNRDVLLVTGSEDDAGQLAVAKFMEEVLKDPRPMTGTCFKLVGSNWQPFLPSPSSAAYWPLKSVAMRVTAHDYEQQKDLLDKLHEASGQDVFVAKQTTMKRADGTLWTWATWVDGVTHALLPEADRIMFGGNVGGVKRSDGWASWERVRNVVGHRMELTEHYPPRYRLRTYPTVEERQSLELRERPE